MNIKVFSSILAADFAHIARDVNRLEDAGADGIHIDVMDGHFVPNLSIGPKMVAAINKETSLFLDVHLMMYNPFDYIESFVESGADMISFHFEATENIEDVLSYIKRCGKKAALAFNPETSLSMIPKYLDKCDAILFMAVNPGFGGQQFMSKILEKIEFTRSLCDKLNIRNGGVLEKNPNKIPPFDIEVDGGINLETAGACIEAGANILVSGEFLFSQKDMKKAIHNLKNA